MTPMIWRMMMFYRWLIFFHRCGYVVSVPLDLYCMKRTMSMKEEEREREYIIKLMRLGMVCEAYMKRNKIKGKTNSKTESERERERERVEGKLKNINVQPAGK
jgi:hypothetical protein